VFSFVYSHMALSCLSCKDILVCPSQWKSVNFLKATGEGNNGFGITW